MKALTIWQPWASLCVEPRPNNPCDCPTGRSDGWPHCPDCRPWKTIETRSWKAPDSLIGQRIAIHAARGLPWVQVDDFEEDWKTDESSEMGSMQWTGPKSAPRAALWAMPGLRCVEVPLGVVVGTAVLADCVQMTDTPPRSQYDYPDRDAMLDIGGDGLWLYRRDDEWWPTHDADSTTGHPVDVSDQRPFGLFEPGRWAWLLTDAVRFAEPIPATGRQGLWNWEQQA